MATAMAMLMRWRAGKMIGAPDMLPLSLAKAITEPVKVTAPIAVPSESSISDCMWMGWRRLNPPASAMPKPSGA